MAALLLLWAATGPMGRWAVMSLADGRELPRGLTLELEGLSGNVLAQPRIMELVVSDHDGDFLIVEDLSLNWNGLALLAGQIDVDELRAARISFTRRPVLGDSAPGGGGLPRLRINEIDISEIELGEPVLGTSAQFSLSGEARLFAGGVFNLEAVRTDVSGDYFQADARWDESGIVSGSTDIFVSGESPIAGLVGLSGLDARLTGRLEGEVSSGQMSATLRLGQYEPARMTADWAHGQWAATIAVDGMDMPERFSLPFDATSRIDVTGHMQPFGFSEASIDGGDWSVELIPVSEGLFDTELSLSPEFLAIFTGDAVRPGRLDWRGQIDRRAGLTADGILETGRFEIGETVIEAIGGGVTLTRRDGANSLFADLTASGISLPSALSPISDLPWLGVAIEARQLDDSIIVPVLDISSDTLNASAELDIIPAQNSLAGAINIRLVAAASVSELASGPLTAIVDIAELSPEGTRLRLDLDATGLAWRETPLADLLASASVSAEVETDFMQWHVRSLQLRSDGILATGEITGVGGNFDANIDAALSGDVGLEEMQIGGGAVLALQLAREDGGLSGAGVVSTPRLSVAGQDLTDPRLGIGFTQLPGILEGDWQAESGTRFGSLIATGTFGRDEDGLALDITSGQLGDRAFTGELSRQPGRMSARLSGQYWALGDGNLSQLEFTAVQQDGDWQFTAEANGELRHDFTLTATAGMADGILAAEFEGLWDDTVIRTREPLTYNFGGDTPGLLARLRVGTGRANIRWTAEDQFRVRLDEMPVDLFGSAFSLPELSGLVEADIAFRDRQGLWSGEISATASNLHITQFSQAAPVTITATGSLDGSLDLQLSLAGDDLSGSANLVRSGRISDLGQLREDAPISGSISVNGAIEPLLMLVLPEIRHLAGQLNADLTLSGSVFQPRLEGLTRLENGRYMSEELGVNVDTINGAATFEDGRLRIDSFSARDPRGGTLTASGEAWRGDAGWQAETRLEFASFNAIRRPDLSIVASGSADISMAESGIAVTGSAELERVDARPPDASATSFAEIEVTEINRPDGRNGQRRSRIPVSLDYRITAPGSLYISGEPFSSEWRGSWHVRGSPDDLDITGDANLISGRAFLLNRAFRLEEGRVSMTNSPRSAAVDLLAIHTRDTITVNARIAGPVTAPALTLSSDPALPQDEILARLLFDQNASQLSPLQTATIAAQLSGQNLFGIVGSLRRAAGLDRLDFDTTSDGQLIATAGQQLTEDVYLELESRGTALSSARLEWTLTPDFTLLSRLTGDTDASIALRWRTEFD